ncbi:MAG: ArsA-related P-loop ATPase [Actinomycetota bacterium]
MKIAVTGKGGAGKTTIAAALARHLARRGHAVVAVDGDPNPNLGISLGVPAERVEGMQPILNALLAAGHTHNDPRPDPDELLMRYGVAAPDGVTLVATGKIERPSDSCLCCGSHMTTREFFGELPAAERMVVADLEAGLNDLIWARPGADDMVLVVAEPSRKAIEIARRACLLAETMGVRRILAVANRAAGPEDLEHVRALLPVDVVAVPEDRKVEDADHVGVAPLDADPASPAMVAIGELAGRVVPA